MANEAKTEFKSGLDSPVADEPEKEGPDEPGAERPQ
jgi:hypothetical protein